MKYILALLVLILAGCGDTVDSEKLKIMDERFKIGEMRMMFDREGNKYVVERFSAYGYKIMPYAFLVEPK